MTKNIPQPLKEITVKLQEILKLSEDCSTWNCSECPLCLKNDEEECGWLLLKSATSKILRK